MKTFNLIVAVDARFGIGKNGTLPWRLPGELKHFKSLTTRRSVTGNPNMVIMGRKTWDSLPDQFRPLPDRINCVLSRNRQLALPEGVLKAESLQGALNIVNGRLSNTAGDIFIIGGAQVFLEAINHPLCKTIYLTQIQEDFNCDTFFPLDLSKFQKNSESALQAENNIQYSFLELQKK